MRAQSRLRFVSLFLMVALLILLGKGGCSNKTTEALTPTSSEDNQDPSFFWIFFTDSDFHYAVEQYAYGDSIYLKAFENRLWPTLSPVWLYSYVHGDMEIFLMDDDRAPPLGIFEYYLVVTAILPEAMTGYGPFEFDGTLTVETPGDSITAYYFSQTHGQLISTGVRIGEF